MNNLNAARLQSLRQLGMVKNSELTTILAILTLDSQLLYKALLAAIKQKRISRCLRILEFAGIKPDLGVYFLKYIQNMEGI